MRRRTADVLVALVVVFVLGACGDADSEPEAQPAEEGVTFVRGDFGDIPVPPLAEEVGPRSEKDDVVAQSYRVRNSSRAELFDFYGERLGGWQVEEAPRPLGDAEEASWRGQWVRDDRRLVVTVSEAPTLEPADAADDDPVVQLSLSLEPARG